MRFLTETQPAGKRKEKRKDLYLTIVAAATPHTHASDPSLCMPAVHAELAPSLTCSGSPAATCAPCVRVRCHINGPLDKSARWTARRNTRPHTLASCGRRNASSELPSAAAASASAACANLRSARRVERASTSAGQHRRHLCMMYTHPHTYHTMQGYTCSAGTHCHGLRCLRQTSVHDSMHTSYILCGN